MFDLEIHLDNSVFDLSKMGEALGKAKVNIEGGGFWVVGKEKVGHFLFEDGNRAKCVLEKAGFRIMACKKVLIQKLNQEKPGQLGKLTDLMAKSGLTIKVLYSDHYNRLILVVDDYERGKVVSENWAGQENA